MTWKPRTLADVAQEEPVAGIQARTLTVGAEADQAAEGEDPRGRPCCHRRVRPSLLVDVTGLPPGLVSGGVRFLCDVCRERLIRSGAIGRADFIAALGGPPEVVERVAERVRRTGRR